MDRVRELQRSLRSNAQRDAAARKTESRRVFRYARDRMRAKRRKPVLGRWLRIAAASTLLASILFVVVSASGAIASAFAVQRFFETLPSPEGLQNRETLKSVKIYDRTGILLRELVDENDPEAGRRTFVPLRDLPRSVISATLATEDPDFYVNYGFDPRGIARAVYQERTGTGQSGGSTITQQLVRNVFFTYDERTDRSYERKVREIALAWQLSQQYPKDRILELYLNEIYYGQLNYGIQAASEAYFGKKIQAVSLAEAAMLAGLPSSPNNYNPIDNPRAAKERQEYVLDLMVRHGFVSDLDAWEAKRQELVYAPPKTEEQDLSKAPHFVEYVKQVLQEKYGRRPYREGWQVYTSLDYGLQKTSEEIVKKQIDTIRKYKATNAAVVVSDPKTGQVLAMVGSADYFDASIDGKYNVALAERQPGSSIKPITYAAAFAKGWTPTQIVNDNAIAEKDGTGKLWVPHNYDDKYHGPMLVREALGNSWNIPAVKALKYVGVETMIEWARKMGISTFKDPSRYGLSITLGGGEVKLLEHAGAYGVFATGGIRNAPTPFVRVVNDRGLEVDVSDFSPKGERVMSEEIAYLIWDTLSDPQARRVTYGLGGPLKTTRLSAAKTGTTDDHRDGWTMGFTPSVVVGVWVGNSNNTPMAGLFGSSSAMPIWHDVIEEAFKLSYIADEVPAKPKGIVEKRNCASTDAETGQCTGTVRDIYIQGFEPKTRVVPGDNDFTKAPEASPTPTDGSAPVAGTPVPGAPAGTQPAAPGAPVQPPTAPGGPIPRLPNTFNPLQPPTNAPPAVPAGGVNGVGGAPR